MRGNLINEHPRSQGVVGWCMVNLLSLIPKSKDWFME
jgi:hypothetical protein